MNAPAPLPRYADLLELCDPPVAPACTRSGFTVSVVEDDGGERVEVRDARRRLVVSVDGATGRTTVEAAEGNLALAAPHGDVEISAGGAVRLASRELAITSRKATLELAETSFVGEKLRAKVDDALVVAERFERIATRVFETAKSVFSTVDDLHQTKVGRVRALVRGGWFLKSGHTSMVSDEETKIDGRQINLG